MRKHSTYFICLLAALTLVACGKSVEERWQEQYDLGQKYLKELDYEQALVAFTNAIEIDPKRIETYVGRGDTYLKLALQGGESGAETQRYNDARSDFEYAYKNGDKSIETVEKLAEIYKELDDIEALENLVAEQTTDEDGLRKWLQKEGYYIQEDGSLIYVGTKRDIFNLLLEVSYLNDPNHYRFLADQIREEALRPVSKQLEAARIIYPEFEMACTCVLIDIYYMLGDLDICLQRRAHMYELTKDDDYKPEETQEGDTVYDKYGNRIRIDNEDQIVSYEYDERGRRIAYHSTSYSPYPGLIQDNIIEYDSDGRIFKHSQTSNSSEVLGMTREYDYSTPNYAIEHVSYSNGSQFDGITAYHFNKYGAVIGGYDQVVSTGEITNEWQRQPSIILNGSRIGDPNFDDYMAGVYG